MKKIKERKIFFDMDGTIADLYGVNNWLESLRKEDESPYINARPLYDVDTLNYILQSLKCFGWRIVITSWLAKESTPTYTEKVRAAKLQWLQRYGFPYDEVHIVKYGTTKANCTRKIGGFQVLVDDNEKVRNGWTLGTTINAQNNILIELVNILSKEVEKNT